MCIFILHLGSFFGWDVGVVGGGMWGWWGVGWGESDHTSTLQPDFDPHNSLYKYLNWKLFF